MKQIIKNALSCTQWDYFSLEVVEAYQQKGLSKQISH